MAAKDREKAVQTRVGMGIALEFAEKCEEAGFTQKEVLNRMILLFNQMGTRLFAQSDTRRIDPDGPRFAASGLSPEASVADRRGGGLEAAPALPETPACGTVSQNIECARPGGTDCQSPDWLAVAPFGKEFRLRRTGSK